MAEGKKTKPCKPQSFVKGISIAAITEYFNKKGYTKVEISESLSRLHKSGLINVESKQ